MRANRHTGWSLATLSTLTAATGVLLAAPAPATATQCFYPAIAGGAHTFWSPDLGNGGFYEAAIYSQALGAYRDNENFNFGQPELNAMSLDPNDDFGCRSEEHGQEWVMPATEDEGITVTAKSYVDPKQPFGRTYVALDNRGAAPVTFDFAFADTTGLGTDTNIDRTSSGDDVGSSDDRWLTACEDRDADGCANAAGESGRAPEIASVWQRQGKPVKDGVDTVTAVDGNADITSTFTSVTLKPGQKAAYMEVQAIALNIKQARKDAAAIAKHPEDNGVFRGLSKKERKRLRNW